MPVDQFLRSLQEAIGGEGREGGYEEKREEER